MAEEISAAQALLQADLGFLAGTVPEPVQSVLASDLAAARGALSRAGLAADETEAEDLSLLVMYAAWLYRKRISGDPMPAMLRQAINDRKVAKATAT